MNEFCVYGWNKLDEYPYCLEYFTDLTDALRYRMNMLRTYQHVQITDENGQAIIWN